MCEFHEFSFPFGIVVQASSLHDLCSLYHRNANFRMCFLIHPKTGWPACPPHLASPPNSGGRRIHLRAMEMNPEHSVSFEFLLSPRIGRKEARRIERGLALRLRFQEKGLPKHRQSPGRKCLIRPIHPICPIHTNPNEEKRQPALPGRRS